MKIPFLDLNLQYQNIKSEIDCAIAKIIDNTAFVGGEIVDEFNKEFATFLSAKYALGVGNGTDALVIALKVLGIKNGDKVIVPANSFIATSEAVSAVGAEVVFVDCDPNHYTIDVSKMKKLLDNEKQIKAIIPVHLYGKPADMLSIMALAKEYNLFVIEDCAQAHGAKIKGKNIGTFGDISTFSFYPGKNLGAYGDGGSLVTNNIGYYKKAKMYANHGRIEKYNHEFEGINSRLDAIQAAVLNVKIKYLESWNKNRNRVADKYQELLKNCSEIALPSLSDDNYSVYHLFVIRAKNRDNLIAFLKAKGISTGIHYPIGLPFLNAYKYLNHKNSDFPVTYDYQNKILSLPIFPEMTDEQILYVCKAIKEFYSINKD